MSNPLRIIFAGTPDFAATSLQALLGSEHEVIAVYTQPDRPSGRGRKLTPGPVKKLALEHDIPVYQPLSLKGEAEQAELAALNADIMVVVAYGLLLPKAVLDTPRLGCINVHGSILPRWRGAAPIHRAVLAGDQSTGITIMQMDVGLDTGDMLYKVETPISDSDTSGDLHDRLAEMGAGALVETLALIRDDKADPEKQDDSLANYAQKLEKQEGRIDWSQPAELIARQVRGLSPWPVAFCELDGQTMRIWFAEADNSATATPGEIISTDKRSIQVGCGQGSLRLTKLQLPGGKPLQASAILNAKRDLFPTGKQLG
ncbi:methionyl-tRNA formyltransferase [Marinobacterium jannaschii]|uniref:methionyl-tRNA formyltransferase n=1 Tax=Marinobacterium jannaschii TaxID=64970 RepID=UPI000480100A|nr:methionyl-tRNA formyltransferase [Marinobacterium jannaschii]